MAGTADRIKGEIRENDNYLLLVPPETLVNIEEGREASSSGHCGPSLSPAGAASGHRVQTGLDFGRSVRVWRWFLFRWQLYTNSGCWHAPSGSIALPGKNFSFWSVFCRKVDYRASAGQEDRVQMLPAVEADPAVFTVLVILNTGRLLLHFHMWFFSIQEVNHVMPPGKIKEPSGSP